MHGWQNTHTQNLSCKFYESPKTKAHPYITIQHTGGIRLLLTNLSSTFAKIMRAKQLRDVTQMDQTRHLRGAIRWQYYGVPCFQLRINWKPATYHCQCNQRSTKNVMQAAFSMKHISHAQIVEKLLSKHKHRAKKIKRNMKANNIVFQKFEEETCS